MPRESHSCDENSHDDSCGDSDAALIVEGTNTAATANPSSEARGKPAPSPARKILGLVITASIVVFIGMAIYKLLHQLDTSPHLWSAAFILGMAMSVIYRVVNAYGWPLILNAMGDPVDGEAATKIWLVAESRRWLPGGVWGYASRATMATQIGVSVPEASASMFLELMFLMAAAVIISVPGVLLYWSDVAAALQELTKDIPMVWLIGGGIACLSAAPLFWKKFGGKVKALQGRYENLRGISLKRTGLLKALAFFVLMAGLNGLVSACLLKSIPGAVSAPLSVIIAATSVAWVVGFVAVFSPGGLIVREGALALLLAPWLPYSTGFTLAILARLVQIFAEVACMAWVLTVDYFTRRSMRPAVVSSNR